MLNKNVSPAGSSCQSNRGRESGVPSASRTAVVHLSLETPLRSSFRVHFLPFPRPALNVLRSSTAIDPVCGGAPHPRDFCRKTNLPIGPFLARTFRSGLPLQGSLSGDCSHSATCWPEERSLAASICGYADSHDAYVDVRGTVHVTLLTTAWNVLCTLLLPNVTPNIPS